MTFTAKVFFFFCTDIFLFAFTLPMQLYTESATPYTSVNHLLYKFCTPVIFFNIAVFDCHPSVVHFFFGLFFSTFVPLNPLTASAESSRSAYHHRTVETLFSLIFSTTDTVHIPCNVSLLLLSFCAHFVCIGYVTIIGVDAMAAVQQ